MKRRYHKHIIGKFEVERSGRHHSVFLGDVDGLTGCELIFGSSISCPFALNANGIADLRRGLFFARVVIEEPPPARSQIGGSASMAENLPFRGLIGIPSEGVAVRILVVEDDAKIASFVIKGLEQSGFAVDHASNGEDGLFLAQTEPYDSAIIDVMLPGRDGLSIIAEMRRAKIATPVIILSAKHSVEDRVRGLQTGSDDYLVKPFTFAELLARVLALIRRSTQTTEPARLAVSELSIDLIKREVVRSGQKIELQPREFSLLEYLMRQPGRVASKTMIMEHIWNYHFDPQTNVVDVLVCRLRNKVDRDFHPKLIHTIRGVGYVIKSP